MGATVALSRVLNPPAIEATLSGRLVSMCAPTVASPLANVKGSLCGDHLAHGDARGSGQFNITRKEVRGWPFSANQQQKKKMALLQRRRPKRETIVTLSSAKASQMMRTLAVLGRTPKAE